MGQIINKKMLKAVLGGLAISLVNASSFAANVIIEKNSKNSVAGNITGQNVTAKKVTSTITSNIVKQRLLVKYRQTNAQINAASATQSLGLSQLKTFRTMSNMQLLEVPKDKKLADVIRILSADPNVEYVEPDREIFLRTTIPNDSDFAQLWALNNTGQSNGVVDADINAPEAWDITTGDANVVLAVIDSGVDYSHVDLKENIWVNINEIAGNGIDDDGNGYIDDVNGIDAGDDDVDVMDIIGHGTHVSGIISARGNNSQGVVGVNWNAKILPCKISSGGGLFLSAAVTCLDYIADLKINHGVNIVASNNSWGWSGSDSQAMRDAIQSNADAGILFVAAAGNSSSDNDGLTDYPSTYYFPNLISVAASDQNDDLTFFTNYGAHTVHVTAPGYDILSTVPGPGLQTQIDQNPHTDIYFDDLENNAITWTAQAPWVKSSTISHSPVTAWTDNVSGDYSNNANTSLTSPAINLTSYLSTPIYLSFFTQYDIEHYFDNLFVEMSGDNGVTWATITLLSGTVNQWKYLEYLIPEKMKTASFHFRFRLMTDDSVTASGIYLDDIGIGTGPSAYDSASLESHSGTSMAAPQVVGLLGLLKAQDPSRTWSQLRNLVIAGGTPLSILADTTISGRRIRAWDANGTGSLSCNNQTVTARLRPTSNLAGVANGGDGIVNISYLHINCGAGAGNVTATVVETGATVELLDNGLGFDAAAGDGIYSLQLDASSIPLEKFTLTFSDASSITITKRDNYIFDDTVAYAWRDISLSSQPIPIINDDDGAGIVVPFKIKFGGDSEGFDIVYINDNGFLSLVKLNESLNLPRISFLTSELPDNSSTRLIAPFWSDMLPGAIGSVSWAVLGVEPQRELVVQWQGVTTWIGDDPIAFQVVFYEENSDILFNYQDVITGSLIFDYGAGSSVGLQITPDIGVNYSYNQASLNNEKSILWQLSNIGAQNTGGGSNPQPAQNSGGGGSISYWLLLLGLIIYLVNPRSYSASPARRALGW